MSDERVKQLEQEIRQLRTVLSLPTSVLSDPTSYINKNKYTGQFVWDETTNTPKWASGPAPSDPWIGL